MFNFSLQISVLLLLFLSATIFNISICSTNKVVRCNENDRKVLLIFKQGVEDPYNRLSSWSNEEDCCAWAGVQCDNITSRVTQLDLHNDNNTLQPESLGGEISLSLLQLEFLHYLDLSHNEFETISIPQLMNFSNLHYLDLSHNSFGMLKLDWLSRISSLEYLSLSGVDLGNETNWLQFMAMLPSISELHLSFCGLRSISPTLTYLDLSYNSFTGEIPIGTQLQSFEAWSFIGNLELCGAPLPKKCNKHEENDNLKLAKGNEDDNFLKSLYLGMGVGFAVGFWGVCGSLFLNKAWRHRFFRLFDGLVDQLYVAMVLKFKSFR